MKLSGKYFPILTYFLVTILLIAATIFFAPSWALMDAIPLVEASRIWAGNNVIKDIITSINHNVYYMPFSVMIFSRKSGHNEELVPA